MDVAEQRLIDANVLADRLQKLETDIYTEAMREKDPVKACISGIVEGIKKQVIAAPTIDAQPVVHARWLPRGSDDNDAGMYYCSACKDERYFGDEVITSEEASKYCPFCPNCGAKMDGGAAHA